MSDDSARLRTGATTSLSSRHSELHPFQSRLPSADYATEQAAALQEGIEERDRDVPDPNQLSLFPADRRFYGDSNNTRQVIPLRPESGSARAREPSLFTHVTRAGPEQSPDPPAPGWWKWVLAEVPKNCAHGLKAYMASGGEARGQRRIRVRMVDTGATIALAIIMVAGLYWLAHLAFDPDRALGYVWDHLTSAASSVRNWWNSAPSLVHAAVAALSTITALSTVTAKATQVIRRRRATKAERESQER